MEELPARLQTLAPLPSPLSRRDLDIGPGGLAFTIEGILTPDEADALTACGEAIFELNGNSRFAPGIQTPPGMRQNAAAHWYGWGCRIGG